MTNIYELSYRSNINVYSLRLFGMDKCIVLYDDHRTLLPVLFDLQKNNLIPRIPDLLFFDYHDDACLVPKEARAKFEYTELFKASSKKIWEKVEFDLSPLDDNWVHAGFIAGLFRHVFRFCGQESHNIKDLNNLVSESGHYMFDISLQDSIRCINPTNKYSHEEILSPILKDENNYHPFVLDIDIDCFTILDEQGHPHALSYADFEEKYGTQEVVWLFQLLIRKSSLITICREPNHCGGIGESNHILQMLDLFFFDRQLNTFSQEQLAYMQQQP